MLRVKTQELTDTALDWAAGIAAGHEMRIHDVKGVGKATLEARTGAGSHWPWRPSKYWNQTEELMLDRGIALKPIGNWRHNTGWIAVSLNGYVAQADNKLTAVLRCFVASILGNEVNVPKILIDPSQKRTPDIEESDRFDQCAP